jgi:ASC-1-like (ASCH) protein
MSTLILNLKKIYFDEIKRGVKPYEFRLDNSYWQKRLQHKDFDTVEFRCGYPKNDDKERIIRRKWMGFFKMTIEHEHFGDEPKEVFAIRTEGKDI